MLRHISLAPETVAVLRAHRAHLPADQLKMGRSWVGESAAADSDADRQQWEDLVFTNEIGMPLVQTGGVRSTFIRLLRKSGLPVIRFHDLLGHSTEAITLAVYSYVLPDMQQDAATTLAAILYG